MRVILTKHVFAPSSVNRLGYFESVYFFGHFWKKWRFYFNTW